MAARWPPNSPRRTQARLKWFRRFRRLKPGHALNDLARRWGESYDAVQHWAHLFGYEKATYRQGPRKEAWVKVNWRRPLKEVARRLGVSQSAVSRRRRALGMPLRGGGQRNSSPAFIAFKRWVREHAHLLHRLPASRILRLAGVEKHVHPFAAAGPLRKAGVLPHDPAWLWRHLDYRLPTSVPAAVWQVNKASVVKARRRLKAPRALWHAKANNSGGRA